MHSLSSRDLTHDVSAHTHIHTHNHQVQDQAAVFGLLAWRGRMCVWANHRFERAFFSAGAAEMAVQNHLILPELLFAGCVCACGASLLAARARVCVVGGCGCVCSAWQACAHPHPAAHPPGT